MKIRAIVADKHKIFRQGLQALMDATEEVSCVALAASGKDTWGLIETLKPDVAILEIIMPEITGLDIARRVKHSGLTTKIILLTSCESPAIAVDAQNAGVSGYVLKSSSFEELMTALRTAISGGTFTSPIISNRIRELYRQGNKITVLSPREKEVIRHISQGKSSKEIARIMDISPRTVDTYRNRIMEKIQAHNVADVVRHAILAGITK